MYQPETGRYAQSGQYRAYLDRAQGKYGASLDVRGLSDQFKAYLYTGVRLKVRCLFGDVTGTVGVTTGWKPTFLLMQRRNSMGSCITLSDTDVILAVKVGKKYIPTGRS